MRMIKMRTLALAVGALVAVALAIPAQRAWTERQSEWPHFAESNNSTPQAVCQFDMDRDWGYRTGNLIPITVFFKVPHGASIDLDSFTVTGDLSLRKEKNNLHSQLSDDGTLYVRLKTALQGFVYQPKLTARASISYWLAGSNKNHTLELEVIEVYPSKTFIQRTIGQGEKAVPLKSAHPDDPPLQLRQGFHALWTVFFLLVGGTGSIWCLAHLMRKPRRSTAFQKLEVPNLWATVYQVWKNIVAGDHSSQACGLMVDTLRTQFKLGNLSVGTLALTGEPDKTKLAAILKLLEDCLWGNRDISAEEVELAGKTLGELKQETLAERAAQEKKKRGSWLTRPLFGTGNRPL